MKLLSALIIGYALGVATIIWLDDLEAADAEYYRKTGKVRPWGVLK